MLANCELHPGTRLHSDFALRRLAIDVGATPRTEHQLATVDSAPTAMDVTILWMFDTAIAEPNASALYA